MAPVNTAATLSRILFVCANNICRSPIAEGVFRAKAQRAGLLDVGAVSAGIFPHHAGEPPDPRALRAAGKRGYDLSRIRARQVVEVDFALADWILAMDESNLRALESLAAQPYEGHLGLLMDLVPDAQTREVPDPYYGGAAQFEHVVDLVESACDALVARIADSGRG